jgi:hypothetical protein
MSFKRALILGIALFGLNGIVRAQDPGPTGPTVKSILYGGTATMYADFAHGTAVIDNGVGTVTSGSPVVVSPTSTTTYTLTVTNLAGDAATQQITVNVASVVVAPISPTVQTETEGKNYTFISSVTGAVDPTINWFVDGIQGGNAAIGTITAGGVYTAPVTTGTHVISAVSNANSAISQSANVTIVPAPVISVPLTATPNAILYGGTSVLSATYTNGTANISGGASNVNPSSSPINWTTPVLSTTTIYTLTVTNPAGDTVTSQATVTVSAVAMTSLGVNNANVSVSGTGASNNSRTITGGVVSGAQDSSVIWQVNGVTGGNSTYGTITTGGVYTAPATLPGNPAITITCMSNEENAITQTLALAVVALPTVTSFTVN